MSNAYDLFESMPDPLEVGEEKWVEWFGKLSSVEKGDLYELVKDSPRVGPMEGPQQQAFISDADIVGYGGAAGGGKSALIAIIALLKAKRTLVLRNDAQQLSSLVEDVIDFHGSTDGLNWNLKKFYFDGPKHMMEWAGISEPNSEQKWQGRAHDFIAADEVTQLDPRKLEFLQIWGRSKEPGITNRTLYTFNPPGDADDEVGFDVGGQWVIDFFAPWIDDRHLNPADPGEKRYFWNNDDGIFEEVPTNEPRETRLSDGSVEMQPPQCRQFIPATLKDNIYLRDTGYKNQLLYLPEPLRSRMLLGQFKAGITDKIQQIIPTRWVDEAMDRWRPEGRREAPMSAMGVDVARGGKAFTVMAKRHKFWWDNLIRYKGTETADGDTTAGLCVKEISDAAWICIDANGVGASPYDSLKRSNVRVHGLVVQRQKGLMDLPCGKMYNLRTWLYFVLAEILNPRHGLLPALPPDNRLRRDLITPTYSIYGTGKYLMQSKEELRQKIGYSPDDGDAVALSCFNMMLEPETEKVFRPQLINFRKNTLHSQGRHYSNRRGNPNSWMGM